MIRYKLSLRRGSFLKIGQDFISFLYMSIGQFLKLLNSVLVEIRSFEKQ